MKKIKLLFGLPILLIGNSVCFAQNWLWAKEGDRQSDPQSNCVAMSNDGGAYLAGTFSDSISFGSWHLKSPYFNSYIVKYDIVGNVVWAEQSNGHSGTECNEICADKMGNAYITGFFSDTIQFGTYTLGNNANNTDELFLVKYDNTGTVAWARESTNLSSGTVAYGNAVATDKSDNVYLTGRFFWGAMQLGAITLNELSSWWNVFLAKYDSAGNVLWAKEANYPSSNCYANGVSVATDDSGNVYLTGQFHDTIIFGTYI